MKRILLFTLIVGVGLWMVGIALAGDYHVSTTLNCVECHTMHYSQTHDYTSASNPVTFSGGPYTNLLRADGNSLCLSCHDGADGTGSTAPDVLGTASYSTARQAGALNNTTGTSPYQTWKGHTLGITSATAPGGTWATDATVGLNCANCHDPHGGPTSQYRNLLLRPGGVGSDLTVTYGTTDATTDVKQTAITPTSTQYNLANIKFNEPSATASGYAAWCQGCHTNFHGSANVGSAGSRTKHPAADANLSLVDFARYDGLTNKVQVMYGSSLDNTATPSCFSCHKAHGNQNAFGLIYMSGTGTVSEQGDGGVYRDLCRQCHSQGG